MAGSDNDAEHTSATRSVRDSAILVRRQAEEFLLRARKKGLHPGLYSFF